MALRRVRTVPDTRRVSGTARLIVFVAGLLLAATPAHADIIRGVTKIIGGVLALPMSALAGTLNGPPVIGTLVGAVSGVFNGVGMVLGGVLDVASSAIPLAKAVAPYVLPFIL